MANQKLSVFEKIGYGLGDNASNLFWMSFVYFQLNFYTDVFGLAASVIATMLLILVLVGLIVLARGMRRPTKKTDG